MFTVGQMDPKINARILRAVGFKHRNSLREDHGEPRRSFLCEVELPDNKTEEVIISTFEDATSAILSPDDNVVFYDVHVTPDKVGFISHRYASGGVDLRREE